MDDHGTAPAWAGMFGDVPEVQCSAPIEGALPPALVGSTLYRNGGVAGSDWTHLFDGDGMIRSLRFESSERVQYRSRFVRTSRREAIERGERPPVVGFGSLRRGLRPWSPRQLFEAANTSNTSLVRVGGELLSLIESGAPYAIDGETLETLGQRTYDGRLGPMRPLGAHPHRCPRTGEVFNFAMRYGRRNSVRVFRQHAAPGGGSALEKLSDVTLPFAVLNHDFALTERHFVFCLGSLRLPLRRAWKLPLGLSSIADAVDWSGKPAGVILLIGRDGSKPRFIEVEPFNAFHLGGAWEQGDEVVVHMHRTYDAVWFDRQLRDHRHSRFDRPFATAHRLRVDTRTGRSAFEEVSDLSTEFPMADPRRYSRPLTSLFAALTPRGRTGLQTAVGRLDLERGEWDLHDFGEGRVVTEPAFAPDPEDAAEGAGWLLFTVYDPASRHGELVVLDARRPSAGPVCRAKLGVNVGFTFHGLFEPPTPGGGAEAAR